MKNVKRCFRRLSIIAVWAVLLTGCVEQQDEIRGNENNGEGGTIKKTAKI